MIQRLVQHIILAFVSLFILISHAYSQEIEWGTVRQSKYQPSLIGETERYIFTAERTSRKRFIFKTLDKQADLSEVFQREYTLPKIKGNIVSNEGLRIINNKYVFVNSIYHKKNKEFRIQLQAFDAFSGESLSSESVLNIEVDGKYKKGKFNLTSSPDQSKLLIVHDVYSTTEKKRIRRYALIDQDLNVLMERDIGSDETRLFKSYFIDNEGSVFYNAWDDRLGMYIASFNANNYFDFRRTFVNFQSKNEDYIIGSGKIKLNEQGEIVVAGYFVSPTYVKEGSNRQRNELRGTYYVRLNKETHSVILSKLTFFDDTFLNQFRSLRDIEKGKSTGKRDEFNSNMSFTDVGNNKMILTGESILYQIYSDQNGYITGEAYEYGDIVSVCFNQDGTLNWAHRIPKRQKFSWTTFFFMAFSSRGVHFLVPEVHRYLRNYSFLHGILDGKVVFVYYDDKKNLGSPENGIRPKTMNNVKTARLKMCTIDIDSGEKNCSKVSENSKNRTFIHPRTGLQRTLNANIIFYSKKGKRSRYGNIH